MGYFVLVLRGVAHTFGNLGTVKVQLLVIHAPAMNAYFAGLHELWNRAEPPSIDDERAFVSKFGITPLPRVAPSPITAGDFRVVAPTFLV